MIPSTTLICALTEVEIAIINEEMMDNANCRLERASSTTVLTYDGARTGPHAHDGCCIALCDNRTINDAWKLAYALRAATNEPEC